MIMFLCGRGKNIWLPRKDALLLHVDLAIGSRGVDKFAPPRLGSWQANLNREG